MANADHDKKGNATVLGYTPNSGPVNIRTNTPATDTLGRTTAKLDISATLGIIGPAAAQPTQTNVGTDTQWDFLSEVNFILIQNNSGASLNLNFESAATSGSLLLANGGSFSGPIHVKSVHLLTAAAKNINGTSAGNIVILGWL